MEETIEELIKTAHLYKESDSKLEEVCGNTFDPIACTVYARKNIHLEQIPKESFDAAYYLNKLTNLHGQLVTVYHVDSDKVRALWFSILNA